MESNKETQANRHPHADMIIEWANDTSKVVEFYAPCYPDEGWTVTEDPSWYKEYEYRFKPEREFLRLA